MKELSVKKINAIGKAGNIIALIGHIVLIIALLGLIAAFSAMVPNCNKNTTKRCKEALYYGKNHFTTGSRNGGQKNFAQRVIQSRRRRQRQPLQNEDRQNKRHPLSHAGSYLRSSSLSTRGSIGISGRRITKIKLSQTRRILLVAFAFAYY